MPRTHRPPAVMIQGAGSNVGKSLITAALCRAFASRGMTVRPFKPQNMSNNAAATPEGGEIGRAQALQARACGVAPSVHMNPVLLKPETDTGCQIIVQGRRWGTLRAAEFGQRKHELLPVILESFQRLSQSADLVIVEGAGSPAEINLRAGDVANMGFAEAADVPVVLVGDIERGGVIASLVGTDAVLSESDSHRIRGFIVNKFRGDVSLFEDGAAAIAKRTGWTSLGVLPFFPGAQVLPAEDILDLDRSAGAASKLTQRETIKIVVPVLGRIANFDDLDPLRLEPGVELELVRPGRPLPLDADLILLPGSKATVQDLQTLRREGWDTDIAAHVRRGGALLGLCGGFQILGRWIDDPDGIEGSPGRHRGLGYLDVVTTLRPDKVVRPVEGLHIASGLAIHGYEIHLGVTEGADCARPLFRIDGRDVGANSHDHRVTGTYVHGVFSDDAFRRYYLDSLRAGFASDLAYESTIEAALDDMAAHLAAHVDIDEILEIARSRAGL